MPNCVSSIVICLLVLVRVRTPLGLAPLSICSGRAVRPLAVILRARRRHSRISASKEMPFADNFLQKQQKQRSGRQFPQLASCGSRRRCGPAIGTVTAAAAEGLITPEEAQAIAKARPRSAAFQSYNLKRSPAVDSL